MSTSASTRQKKAFSPKIPKVPDSLHQRNKNKRTSKSSHKFVLLPDKEADEEQESLSREVLYFSDNEESPEAQAHKLCRVTAYVTAE
jgi:uncharacterized Rmd1/YagE family protein